MAGHRFGITFGGMLALGLGCAVPVAAPQRSVELGRRLDPERLAAMQRGITTRTEAIASLGAPDQSRSDPQEGTTTLVWSYRRVEAHGSLAILTVLKFDAEDRLLVKAVSQDSQSR
jgi:hypothetical protein